MNQLSLDVAIRKRDQGMAQAEAGANATHQDWSDAALEYLSAHARSNEVFPAYFVTQPAEKFFPGVNQKAWGPIFQRALRLKLIEKTGTYVPHPQRHACPAIVYRSRIFRGRASG